MPEILFQEFRDEQLASNYPFGDGADLTSITGLRIEPDIFLDASLYPIGARAQLAITNINITLQIVTITIGDGANSNRATGAFSLQDVPEIIQFYDEFERPAGIIVADVLRLALFQSWATGDHRFLRGAAEFVASCVIPQPGTGVRAIATTDGTLFTDDVYLIGEDGVVLREESEGVIRVDIVGDPLFKRRVCSPVALFETPRFLKTINGVPPDEYGNFVLDVSTNLNEKPAMRIYAIDDRTLKFEIVGSTLKNG